MTGAPGGSANPATAPGGAPGGGLPQIGTWLKDQGKDFRMAAGMAKLFAGETATRACNHAVQIHGGYGVMEEFPVARYWRDVKIHEIGEGTPEIQRMVIARLLDV